MKTRTNSQKQAATLRITKEDHMVEVSDGWEDEKRMYASIRDGMLSYLNEVAISFRQFERGLGTHVKTRTKQPNNLFHISQ